MPKLTIEHSHGLDPAEVKKRLDDLSSRLAAKYGIDARWKSDSEATFKRTGASGTITVTPGKVSIFVDLSFALSPVKSKIEHRIKEELVSALS